MQYNPSKKEEAMKNHNTIITIAIPHISMHIEQRAVVWGHKAMAEKQYQTFSYKR